MCLLHLTILWSLLHYSSCIPHTSYILFRHTNMDATVYLVFSWAPLHTRAHISCYSLVLISFLYTLAGLYLRLWVCISRLRSRSFTLKGGSGVPWRTCGTTVWLFETFLPPFVQCTFFRDIPFVLCTVVRRKIVHEKYMFWNHEFKVCALASSILSL